MPDELLISARDQAERSEPEVRVAAFLRIARVESAVNREQARKTFERALAETRQIAGVDGDFLLAHARLIAAAVAPDLLPDIPALEHLPRHVTSDIVGRIMLDHQHRDAAFDYVVHYDDSSSFPFGVAAALMRSLDNDVSRLAVLRSSIAAWRTARQAPHFHLFQFISIFQSQWKLLPPEEAAGVAREIVRVALEQPDQPVSANYDPEGNMRITSGRAHTLFQIFHILRQVDGPLAESLIAGHEQLAAALQRFPNGMETVTEETEARRAEARRTGSGGGFGMAGSPGDFPYMKALMQASQDGEFGPAIQHATEKYREDAVPESPNRAPKEFWPSASRFRSVLYKAGKQLGHRAAVHLEAIPDADLRLFAQIELAAALAGLPELHGLQREYRHTPGAAGRQTTRFRRADAGASAIHRDNAVDARIRCPKCQWSPDAEARWSCRCRHIWNTFETRGLCPACGYQWTVTACLNCGQSSAHSAWYKE
jgi:hypothetical protein